MDLKLFLKTITSIMLVACLGQAEVKKFKVGQCFSFNELAIRQLKINTGIKLHPLEELFIRSMILKVKEKVSEKRKMYTSKLVYSLDPISPFTARLYNSFNGDLSLVETGGGLLFNEVKCARQNRVDKNLKQPGEVTDNE